MKYLQLLILFGFIVSCSGTKKVISDTETSSSAPTSVKKNKDSIVTKTTEIIKYTDSLYVPQSDNDIEIVDTPIIEAKEIIEKPEEESNQILNKKTIKIHELWDELLTKHVSKDGNVNYKSLKKEYKKLLDYIRLLDLIYSHDDFESVSIEEKLAFWINAYNAMTVDLILRHYPIKSIKDIKNPWKQRYWQLGKKWFNLDEIEHQILRKMDEPRIHFAIVCASYSCPKLQNKAFTAHNIEQQLTSATKEFLSDSERNTISKNSLELSKVFQWFAKDFKQNGSLIDFLNTYSETKISNTAKTRFKDYNWDLNE